MTEVGKVERLCPLEGQVLVFLSRKGWEEEKEKMVLLQKTKGKELVFLSQKMQMQKKVWMLLLWEMAREQKEQRH